MNSPSPKEVRQVLPREVLERLLVFEGRPAALIADDTGVAEQVVLALADVYGLARRPSGPGIAARIDPDELYRLACVERVGMEELGRRLGVPPDTALAWIRRFGVPQRPARRQTADTPGSARWFNQEELVELWDRGRSCEQISEATGIYLHAVRRRLEAAGALGRSKDAEGVPAGDAADPGSRAVLERLYRGEKMSPSEIARATGSTPRKVSFLLEHFGIARYRLGERVLLEDLTPGLLRSLYTEQQWSIAEIARMLGCGPRRVSGLLRQWGIPARERGGRTALSRRALEDLHVARGLTAEQIALRLGYLRANGEPATARVREALYRHSLNLPASEREINDADLEALYVGEGLDEAQIAERLGWRSPHGRPSVLQVRRRLMRSGIYRPPTDTAPSPGTEVLLGLYREDGLSPEQIALQVGWRTRTGRPAVLRVRECLRRAGETVPDTTHPRYLGPAFDAEQLHRLYIEEGMSVRQVTERLGWRTRGGVPQTEAVRAALHEAGIPVRPRGRAPRGKA